MGMPKERVRGLMERTLFNLDYIHRRQRGKDGPFEVTQLLNSFLGALIHPKEAWFEFIPMMPISELAEDGWPPIPNRYDLFSPERTKPESPKHLQDLVRLMRNALAHGNMELIPDRQGNINGIRLWNLNKQDKVTWATQIDTFNLDQFLRRFVKEMLRIDNEMEGNSAFGSDEHQTSI